MTKEKLKELIKTIPSDEALEETVFKVKNRLYGFFCPSGERSKDGSYIYRVALVNPEGRNYITRYLDLYVEEKIRELPYDKYKMTRRVVNKVVVRVPEKVIPAYDKIEYV